MAYGKKDIALKLKQWQMLLYTPVEDPMLTAVCARLGCSIRINSATPRHRMQVIVRLGRAFELCNFKGRQLY